MDALDPKDLQPQTMLGMKLIQQPFSKAPLADRLFDFDSLKQTRDTVSHHLQFSHLLMVIQGKKGSGKNSFANSLIVSEHPALYFFNASAESGDSLRDVLGKAAQNNNAGDIEILEKRFHDIMYRGQQPILIINDAHLLGSDILREAISYAGKIKDDNQQSQLKLLLLGDQTLEKSLETNGILNHNQFYIIDLPQLNVSNTRAFLEHRLTHAGFRDPSPFSDKDITNIFNMANGNPDTTLQYAAETLNNNKSLYEEEFGSPGNTRKNLIIVGAVLFAAAFAYNSLLNTDGSPTPESTTKTEDISLPSPDNSASDTNNAANPLAGLPPAQNRGLDQLFQPGNKSSNTMDVKQPSLKADTNRSLAPALPLANPQTKPTTANPLKSVEIKAPVIKPANKISTASGIPLPTQKQTEPLLADAKEAQKATAQKSPSQKSLVEKTVTKPASTSTVKPAPAESVVAKPATDKTTLSFINAGTHSPQWLLKQPEGNWGLQILGAYKPETLLDFVHQHKLGKNVAYYRTSLGGKDWHVILYGQYSSKENAKAVIPQLPAYIRENNPWPKDMKSVHQAIKQP